MLTECKVCQASKALSGVSITADATQQAKQASAPPTGVRKRVAIAAKAAVDPASVKIPNHPKSESVLRVLGADQRLLSQPTPVASWLQTQLQQLLAPHGFSSARSSARPSTAAEY